MFKPTRSASVIALIAATAAALPAAAQEEARADNTVLEEIIVTANKRPENLQQIPSSVAAISGEKVDVLGSGGVDIRFLSGRVPSLNIESSFGRTFPRFYIRGLGNTDFDLNASQPVSLVYDNVVLENPILKSFPIFDVERIEVLRGPQGTLFGRNTTAGIVKIDSKKPTQELDGYISASYGRFNTKEVEGAIGGPLIQDVLAVRASVNYQDRSNWIDNLFLGEEDGEDFTGGFEDIAGRFQILYTPTENFSALINAHFRSLEGTARVFRANIFKPGTNDLADLLRRSEIRIDGENGQSLDTFGVNADLSYDFGEVTLTSITGYEEGEVYSRGDVDGGFGAAFLPTSGPGFIPFSSESADGVPKLEQYTQELRLASNNWDSVNWQVGFFYFDEDLQIDSFSFDSLFGGVQNGFASQVQDSESWAIFGSVDYNVTDRLNLKAGLRYSDDERTLTAQRFSSPLAFLGIGPTPPITVDVDDDDLSWDLAATYALNNDVNVYGRVATSYRAPSIQGRVLFGAGDGSVPALDGLTSAEAETIISYEGGFKSQLLEDTLRLNVSLFYYEVDDQQITAVGGAQNVNTLLNVDTTVGWGMETDVEWQVNENTFTTFGASYNDTKFKDDNLFVTPCGGGCTVIDPIVNGLANINGNPLPQAPQWIVNWTLRYAQPIGDDAELFWYTDWRYRSNVNFFLYEAEEFKGKSLLEGGLRFGYAKLDGSYEVAGFMRNITNERVAVGGIDFNNLTGFLNEPRVWGVEVSYRY